MKSKDPYSESTYEIQVQGALDSSWVTYFNGFIKTPDHPNESPITTLIAQVVDQPALRGLLCKLWDLNLTLISVRRLEAGFVKEKGND
jgi:hypothetical protein